MVGDLELILAVAMMMAVGWRDGGGFPCMWAWAQGRCILLSGPAVLHLRGVLEALALDGGDADKVDVVGETSGFIWFQRLAVVTLGA